MKFRCLLVTIMTVVTVLLPSFAQESEPQDYIVKLVYFLPNDSKPQQDIEGKIDKLIKRAQQFYAAQLDSYGFGEKTFRFETDKDGNAVVHHIIGEQDKVYYQKNIGKCIGESAKKIQTRNTVLVVYLDHGKKLLRKGAAGLTYSGRRVLIPAVGQGLNVLVHELGHAFGLPHDFRNGTYIMSYGATKNKMLSEGAAKCLNVNRYFNIDKTRSEIQTSNHRGKINVYPHITAYPPDDMRVHFEIVDDDGLYLARTLKGPWPNRKQVGMMVQDIKSLDGKKDIVGFSSSQLTQGTHNMWLQVLDVKGKTTARRFSFKNVQPNLILNISPGITQVQEGIIGHWNFDEAKGQFAFDSSGNGNYARLKGGTTFKNYSGKIGGALKPDDSSGVIVANGSELINGLKAFTIALWVKSDSVGTNSGLIYPDTRKGKSKIFSMSYNAKGPKDGKANVIAANITTIGGTQTYQSASNMQTEEWQHIALTWQSGGKLTLYINGVLDQPTFNSKATEGEVTGVNRLLIGSNRQSGKGSWKGLIDDVRLYNRVLSQEEIMVLPHVSTTTTPVYGTSLAGVADLPNEPINTSKDVKYILTVTNIGNTKDTIKLAITGNVPATLSQTSVLLSPSASSKVVLTIPRDVFTTAGDYVAKVVATSESDGAKTTQIKTTTTIKPGHFKKE